MTEEVTIRSATAAELPAVARLAAAMVRFHHALDPARYMRLEPVEPGYEKYLRSQLRRPEAVLLVAAEGAELVGYAFGRIEPRDYMMLLDEHGAFHDLYVEERARGRGVGTRLGEAMLRELRARGATRVVLYSAVANERAQRLAERLGFRRTMVEMARDLPDS